MMAAPPLFEIRGLVKRYEGRAVLAGLDFDVARGECFAILGRSGCGKSVTLRQLVGLERPDAGTVRFDGTDLTTLSEEELYPVRRRVAMLFQSGALFDSLDVFENVAFPLREHARLAPDELARRVAEKLALVHLTGSEERLPAQLSGGMRKRVALARAIALDPEAVLFDEPTTGLDPMTSASIARLIRDTTRQLGVTAVVVTHDLALTRHVADRIAFLDGGRFRFVGTWQEAEATTDPLVGRFLAGQPEEGEDVV
ncbi:MAG: putative phospholipid import ATP-binding protein MlaF [Acidobacteria bacterium ADurb.Bin051]|jgi:phospholipid/cholesterol/gamma-HCH transport system ATP-binding protein|nr:MAG: putative phospholipid import ATP-binding protein MlaF [Acidobacteria bacterium ADurb.Bin051]